MQSVVVLSHLRWGFVYQRPQHVLSRLARHWRILFVEEPVFDPDPAWCEFETPSPNVTVLRPHTPITVPGFRDEQSATLRGLIAGAIEREDLGSYGAWLYTPMGLPLLESLAPEIVIYDCMDELAAFKGAPRQLIEREHSLMSTADVVFTGGPSLYETRQGRHHNIHMFPSSVDREHFARAMDPALTHHALATLPHPRLGFFGVVDERFDADLLRHVAMIRSDWQFCVVGPVIKIDPTGLPRLPNVHYFDQQPYESLPAFMAGWAVCLLPFARNESTRFISPTKTLEYMSAELPIVSTTIADVKTLYGSVVRFGDSPEEFAAACDGALNESLDERRERQAAMRAITAGTSWERTAAEMRSLIAEAIASRAPTTDRALSDNEGDNQVSVEPRSPRHGGEASEDGRPLTGFSEYRATP